MNDIYDGVTTWQQLTGSLLDVALQKDDFLKMVVFDVFSNSIYHELHHVVPFKLIDESRGDSYLWEECMAYTDSQSLRNVQNHVFLGALAQLEQKKIRLSYEHEQAIAGQVVRDPSLPLVS